MSRTPGVLIALSMVAMLAGCNGASDRQPEASAAPPAADATTARPTAEATPSSPTAKWIEGRWACIANFNNGMEGGTINAEITADSVTLTSNGFAPISFTYTVAGDTVTSSNGWTTDTTVVNLAPKGGHTTVNLDTGAIIEVTRQGEAAVDVSYAETSNYDGIEADCARD